MCWHRHGGQRLERGPDFPIGKWLNYLKVFSYGCLAGCAGCNVGLQQATHPNGSKQIWFNLAQNNLVFKTFIAPHTPLAPYGSSMQCA